MCCLYFSFTSPKYPSWLQKCMQPKDLSSRLNCKQASCSMLLNYTIWSALLKIATQNPQRWYLQPSPREHPCTSHDPEGPGHIWCSLLWRGPTLQMVAVWKYAAEAHISLWIFLFGYIAPFEFSHNCTSLVHTCSLPEPWVGDASGACSMQAI